MVPNLRKHLIALFLLTLSLPACGVVFSSDFEGTELFRKFALESTDEADGIFAAGTPIEVTLTVNQAYPVPVAVSCRYENVDITDDQRRVAFNERASPVFETVLPANPGHHPGDKDDVPDDVLEFEFTVTDEGDYFVACFAVAAPENGIGRGFTVEER